MEENKSRTGNQPKSPQSGAVWFLFFLFALFAMLRVLTYGHSSPWIDEINNWLTARENGFRWREGSHQFTYILQTVGLRLADSTWGLRLYAVIFSLSAAGAGVVFIRRHVSLLAAFAFLLLVFASPFFLFYSADANHYAPLMLAGIGATTLVYTATRGTTHPAWLTVMAITVLVGIGFHPLGMLPLAALITTAWLWAIIHAGRLPMGSLDTRTRRHVLILLTLVVTGAGLLLLPVSEILGGKTGVPVGARRVGLSSDFVLPLLADLYSTLFQHQPLDYVIGLIAFAASVAGWMLAWRSERRWLAVGFVSVAAWNILPFYLFETSHYFYPKFLAPSLPGLLMGIALLIDECWKRRAIPGKIGLAACTGVALLLMIGSGRYMIAERKSDYQPVYTALEYMESELPKDAILLTRNELSSRAMGFLWKRNAQGSRQLLPLSDIEYCGAPSIQQAEEILAGCGNKPVYFVSLLESREMLAEDFAAWIRQNSTVVARFDSWVVDDFVPLDRDIYIRQLIKHGEQKPFSLPRSGARTSTIVNERDVDGSSFSGGGRLEFPLMTGAGYKFEAEERQTGIVLDYTWNGTGSRPDWLIAAVDGTTAFAIRTSELSASGSVVFACDIQSGPHRFDFYLNNEGGDRARRPSRFTPDLIGFAGYRDDGAIRLKPWTQPDLSTADNAPILAIQYVYTDGEEDLAADVYATIQDGERVLLARGIDWLFLPGMSAAVFDSPAQPALFQSATVKYRRHTQRPRGPVSHDVVTVDDLRFYTEPGSRLPDE